MSEVHSSLRSRALPSWLFSWWVPIAWIVLLVALGSAAGAQAKIEIGTDEYLFITPVGILTLLAAVVVSRDMQHNGERSILRILVILFFSPFGYIAYIYHRKHRDDVGSAKPTASGKPAG